MKKVLLLILTILFINTNYAQVKGSFTTKKDNYTFKKYLAFDVIESDANVSTEQIGAPKLPVYIKKYVLPAGSTFNEIVVNTSNNETINGSYYLFPSQPPCPTNGEKCPDFVEPDPAIYNSKTPYPKNNVEVVSDIYTMGYHIVSVKISPFKYLPKTKELSISNQINFSISYSVGEHQFTKRISEYRNNLAKDFVRSQVENDKDVKSIKTAKSITSTPVHTDKLNIPYIPSDYGDMPDYIIITNETLKPTYDAFATYKIQKGIPTLVVTVEQIYNDFPGCDNAEKIRNYIKEAHTYWGDALFVLLGGDTSVIPERIGTKEGSYFRTTDMYYCDVYKPGDPTYNWNSDGDSDFGWDTPIELGADNFIGRAPTDTIVEAQNFIAKIISYENLTDVTNLDYVNNTLFMGAYVKYKPSVPYYIPSGMRWFDYVYHQDYFDAVPYVNKWRVYDDYLAPGDSSSSTPNQYPGDEELDKITALDRLNNGHPTNGKNFHLVAHLDHGGAYGVGVSGLMKGDGLVRPDMDGLSNGSYYQIMYTAACEPGEFEKDCFAEHYVNATNGGGVAILANSGYGWTNSERQPKELFKSIYDTSMTNGHILGLASEKAKYACGNVYSSQKNKVKNLALFGEPTMEIWTNTPQNIVLNVPTSISINNAVDNELVTTINALTEDASITLYKFNNTTNEIEIYASQDIDAGDTSATFILHPDTEGDLLVKATAKNYLPDTATVNILFPEAHLYITGTSFIDSNGNGAIEQGETISLDIQLTNSGDTNISDITAILSADPSIVSITDNTATYPSSIAPDGTGTLSSYTFDVLVTSETPSFIEFSLDISTTSGYLHTDTFILDLQSSNIELSTRLTTDSLGNPIVDFAVDEDVNLYIDLLNSGIITEEGIEATLSSSLEASGIMEISSNTSNYPNIAFSETQTNTNAFVFKLLDTYSGSMPFTLNVVNSLGKTWTFNFDLVEELPPLITGFDFISNREDITIMWEPPTDYILSGYNVYRSSEIDGTYTKMNDYLITGSSLYFDTEVAELTQYYYKISVVSESGNELAKEQLITTADYSGGAGLNGYIAWTSLNIHDGFPVQPFQNAASGAYASPTVFDVNGDGMKEIFINYRNSGGDDGDGRIMALDQSGEELFEIDGNPTELWGFAATSERLDVSKPAIGDIDNDGHAEVLCVGRNNGTNTGMLYGFHTVDNDADNNPDVLWNKNLGHRTYRNPVLADLTNDGYMESIVLDEGKTIHIYDYLGNLIGEKQVTGGGSWSLGELAIGDVDNDGYKEILAGFQKVDGNKGAIIMWNHNGDFSTDLTEVKVFSENERADSGVVLADINGDRIKEIFTITKTVTTGKVYALNIDGTPINANWNGMHTLTIQNGAYEGGVIPRIAVGDLNLDGVLEIVYGSKDTLFMLNNEGTILQEIAINKTVSTSPILGDIDDDDEIEVIINSNGKLFAYNYDGSECIGWRLQSYNSSPLTGSPFLGDIDADGFNEVVISSEDCITYVWNTTGDADKIEWGSYRANAQNTAVYLSSTAEFDHFVTTWKTDNYGTSTNTKIEIPTTGGGYNYDVDWDNDGIFDDFGITGNATHDYGAIGTYTVRIRGDFPRIYFNNQKDKLKILSVKQWGSQVWSSMYKSFYGCKNLNGTASDNPDLSNVSNMSYMFTLAKIFNGNISEWNVSNVTNMRSMFNQAFAFNQDIGSWNVGNVKNMKYMFSNAHVFNKNIGAWDVSHVKYMDGMFGKAYAFNQNIGEWNVGLVKTMKYMFYYANSFDQNLENWDVSNVSYMNSMFKGITLSRPNYDALLIGWSDLILKNNVNFHGGNSHYCLAEEQRQSIIDTFNWTITDAGMDCSCTAETYWTGSHWDSILPDSATSAVMAGDYDTDTYGSFTTCKMSIKEYATVVINENDYISVINDVYSEGKLIVEDTGSLVQIADETTVNGPGLYRVYRKTTPYVEYDYTYWSSPSSNEITKDAFYYNSSLVTGTGDPFSHPNYVYWFKTENFNDDDDDSFDDEPSDDWQHAYSTDILIPGKGYIAMGAGSDIPFDPSDFESGFQQEVFFEGAFNSGDIIIPISEDNSETDDFLNQNLIGNPYPSAIDMNKLMAANNSALEGTFYFWTHDTPVSSGTPGPDAYNFTNDDYAIATSDGTVYSGVASTSGTLPTQFIASAQGFFVNTLTTGPEKVIFTNSMRITEPNDEFRTNKTITPYLDRVRLDLKNRDGLFRQILVNFYANGTIDFDPGLDGQRQINGSNTDFYSIIESDNRRFAIQTQDKFSIEKKIRLGIEIIDEGIYTIGINDVKGVFETGQQVYLEDKDLGIIHNLSEEKYEFYTNETEGLEKRFILRFTYKKDTMLNDDEVFNSFINIYPNPSNGVFNITWNGADSMSITITDLSGKVLVANMKIQDEGKVYNLDLSTFSKGVYLAKLEVNNKQIVKKLLVK